MSQLLEKVRNEYNNTPLAASAAIAVLVAALLNASALIISKIAGNLSATVTVFNGSISLFIAIAPAVAMYKNYHAGMDNRSRPLLMKAIRYRNLLLASAIINLCYGVMYYGSSKLSKNLIELSGKQYAVTNEAIAATNTIIYELWQEIELYNNLKSTDDAANDNFEITLPAEQIESIIETHRAAHNEYSIEYNSNESTRIRELLLSFFLISFGAASLGYYCSFYSVEHEDILNTTT